MKERLLELAHACIGQYKFYNLNSEPYITLGSYLAVSESLSVYTKKTPEDNHKLHDSAELKLLEKKMLDSVHHAFGKDLKSYNSKHNGFI